MCFFSTAGLAGMNWTDDYWRGEGVEVDNAIPSMG